jgi:hypothetical protein
MIGDYMTKPLQGALFRKFRNMLMGVVPIKDPGTGKVKPHLELGWQGLETTEI